MKRSAGCQFVNRASQALLLFAALFSLVSCSRHHQADAFETTDRLYGLWARDGALVWAVGEEGSILHSKDGGQHWELQKSGTESRLVSIFGNGLELWTVGADGTILHSTDGGEHWKPQKSGIERHLFSVYAVAPQVWAVGERGIILHSTNGGQDWKTELSGIRGQLSSIYATGPMVWTVCRQILPEPHDAEDAFQATLLVLVRKARSIKRRDSLKSWLHGVAYRIAIRAKSARPISTATVSSSSSTPPLVFGRASPE